MYGLVGTALGFAVGINADTLIQDATKLVPVLIGAHVFKHTRHIRTYRDNRSLQTTKNLHDFLHSLIYDVN